MDKKFEVVDKRFEQMASKDDLKEAMANQNRCIAGMFNDLGSQMQNTYTTKEETAELRDALEELQDDMSVVKRRLVAS